MWAVDKTASGIVAEEKKHLSNWVDQVFPAFPVVGNIVSDLLESQRLSFSDGLPHYQMRSKKRIAPNYQFGVFSSQEVRRPVLRAKILTE